MVDSLNCCTVTVVPDIALSLFSRSVLTYIKSLEKIASPYPRIALLLQRALDLGRVLSLKTARPLEY